MACYNRDAMMRIRAGWKARGLCTRCGGERGDKWSLCLKCRVKNQQYRQKDRAILATEQYESRVSLSSDGSSGGQRL